MNRRPPESTRTDTLFPYTTLFRSALCLGARQQRPIGGGKLLQVLARQPARQRPGGLAVAVARRRVGGEPGAGQQAVQQEVEVLGHAQPLVLPQPDRKSVV